jgi:hypothetical protein
MPATSAVLARFAAFSVALCVLPLIALFRGLPGSPRSTPSPAGFSQPVSSGGVADWPGRESRAAQRGVRCARRPRRSHGAQLSPGGGAGSPGPQISTVYVLLAIVDDRESQREAEHAD